MLTGSDTVRRWNTDTESDGGGIDCRVRDGANETGGRADEVLILEP